MPYTKPMQLYKHRHACFVITYNQQSLVVDPGGLTSDFMMPDNVAGVILTHQHADHTDETILKDIVRRYPSAMIITTPDNDLSMTQTALTPPQALTVGEFQIELYGGQHAPIDSSITPVDNLAVMINDLVYYPGDSFVAPMRPIDTLLLPVAAPWMKTSEALDFVRATRPLHVIPTHDAILSEAGQAIVDQLVGKLCQDLSITYSRLSSDDRLTIS